MAGHLQTAAMLPGAPLRRDDGAVFVVDPVGRYVVRRSFLVWCASETLSGVFLWGSPDTSDASELAALCEFSRGLRGYDSIIDACRIRRVDSAAIQTLADWLQARIASYAEAINRQI